MCLEGEMQRENLEWKKLRLDSVKCNYWVSNYGDIKRCGCEYQDKAGRKLKYIDKFFWAKDQSLSGGNKQGRYKTVSLEGKNTTCTGWWLRLFYRILEEKSR